MCKDCGCGLPGDVAIDGEPMHAAQEHEHGHGHAHVHGHEHVHGPGHAHEGSEVTRTLVLEKNILEKNDRLAERNRGYFDAKGVTVLNLLASPGAGKTMLLERTAEALGNRLRIGVIVGDLATENDAARLRSHGLPAVQITTGSVCHLDAEMIEHAVRNLDLNNLDILFIENVGNLVCPAIYDLGESSRVVLMSVTEGEDKPLKYPVIYRAADVVVITKIDLAGAVEFDRETALRNVALAAPDATVLEVSARSGAGMEEWCSWIKSKE